MDLKTRQQKKIASIGDKSKHMYFLMFAFNTFMPPSAKKREKTNQQLYNILMPAL